MTQTFKQFAIILDGEEKKTNKTVFQQLIDSLRGKKEKKDPIKHKLQDLLSSSEFAFEQEFRVGGEANRNKYFLMRDFDELVDLLSSYCDDEPKRKHKDNKYEIEVTVELPKRKRIKNVTVYDKITILERWVKIGYHLYRRQFDPWSGTEYIVVDGDIYDVKSDRNGREYLA
jgi:hypothetical protein